LSRLWAPLQPRKRRRQGGWRQQIRRGGEEAGDEPTGPSYLAMGQLVAWSDGLSSAAALQRQMSYAVRDGLRHPMVERFANVAPDQHSHAGVMSVLAEAGIADLVTRVPVGGVTSVILPSTYVQVLRKHYPREFRLRLGAEPAKVDAFWNNWFASPARRAFADQHDVLRGLDAQGARGMVPLTIHEDAGPCSKLKSANCISFSSLLGCGDEKISKFLCSSYIQETGGPREYDIWKVILEDLDMLARGELAGNAPGECFWRFVLLFAKSDEDCHANHWGLKHYSDANEICTECLANRTTQPFTNLLHTAEWRPTTLVDKASYIARVRVPLHPLFASKYATRYLAFLDIMHLLDCKGVAALVCGGILMRLLVLAKLGHNRQERLDTVNKFMKKWYDDHPRTNRLPPIRLGNLTADGWADLHGPAIKAAATRAAAPAFLAMCNEHLLPAASLADERTCAIIDRLVKIYDILYTETMFMSGPAIELLRGAVLEFGCLYMHLREHARVDNILAWPVKPKVHKLQHVPDIAVIVNPRFCQCYAEESLIGTTVRVWKIPCRAGIRTTCKPTFS